MYPLIGKIYLDTVNVIDFLLCIDTLYLGQDGIDIGTGFKVYTVLCDKVRRIGLAQFTYSLALMCKMTEEEITLTSPTAAALY